MKRSEASTTTLRKAITRKLGTVFVAGILVGAGLVYVTLFANGSLSTKAVTLNQGAEVSVAEDNCAGSNGTATLVCVVYLSNTGSASASTVLNSASITFGGTTYNTAYLPSVALKAGTSTRLAINFPMSPQYAQGESFNGSISLADYGSVLFSGRF
ncbi:MAG: hypothetical protein OK452_08335 [Thaumarchaeota archaeon]|nr:hypothetical protein [Nitrososphaerota archaeon]